VLASAAALNWVLRVVCKTSSVSATMLANGGRSFACRTAPRCRRDMSSLAALATATAHYDLIVIGSGPSAVACARESARFGKVSLISGVS
jgi:NADPH-dependent 2,4-dienoyl-CoA reductase/sulfur reductase-like enzyme